MSWKDAEFRVGQLVKHKASGQLGVIEKVYTKWCNNVGGHHIPNGWYQVSYGFGNVADIRENCLEEAKEARNDQD